jgi:NADH-quinone oxidoreductase subunit G
MAKVREAVYNIGGKEIKVAVVHGLANAKLIADDVRAGKSPYNFIEVMACPGGCIAGAGQPITHRPSVREMRARGLYHTDKNTLLQKPQDNYQVEKSYEETLGGCPGSHEAHEMLHTYYKNRSHLFDAKTRLLPGAGENAVSVTVTVRADGKNCEGKELLSKIADYIKFMEWTGKVNLDAAFTARPLPPDNICVSVGDEVLDKGDFESVKKALDSLVAPAD